MQCTTGSAGKKLLKSFFLLTTLDLQMVNLSLRVLYKPKEDMIHEIYRLLGTDYDGRVLPSVVNEVLKAVVAKYTAQSLLTKRDE